jgi:crotonobetainyl-CoA:carnitine CoA-transferase CaiB-like acyl-CoA transferase
LDDVQWNHWAFFFVIGKHVQDMLAGCRVVNVAYNLPGPIAANKLSQYGAFVTKVEPPGGDPLERFCTEWYAALTSGQEILQLNLKTPADSNHFHELLSQADILITSMRPSALLRLGLGWDKLGPTYSRLCHVEIIGYPPPDEEKPGHDLSYQAEQGLLSPPEMPRMLLADFFGAELAVQAALLMLVKRFASGQNGHMCVSLAASLEGLSWPQRSHLTGSLDKLGGGWARYNIYKTKDGWIALAALEDKYWSGLISQLGLTEEEATKERLEIIFLQRDSEDWQLWAEANDLPITAVKQ